jgi:hypothetical protein
VWGKIVPVVKSHVNAQRNSLTPVTGRCYRLKLNLTSVRHSLRIQISSRRCPSDEIGHCQAPNPPRTLHPHLHKYFYLLAFSFVLQVSVFEPEVIMTFVTGDIDRVLWSDPNPSGINIQLALERDVDDSDVPEPLSLLQVVMMDEESDDSDVPEPEMLLRCLRPGFDIDDPDAFDPAYDDTEEADVAPLDRALFLPGW